MTIKILRNATIFDGHGEELTEGGSIVIEGDRIREVGGSSLRCDGADVVALDGRFLMPGLLDIHFHAYGITFTMHRMDRLPMPLTVEHAARLLHSALPRG